MTWCGKRPTRSATASPTRIPRCSPKARHSTSPSSAAPSRPRPATITLQHDHGRWVIDVGSVHGIQHPGDGETTVLAVAETTAGSPVAPPGQVRVVARGAHAVRRRAGERVRPRRRQPVPRRRDLRADPAGDGRAARRRAGRRPRAGRAGGLDARPRSAGGAARRRRSALHRPVHPCRTVRRPRRRHRTDEPGARRRGRGRPDQRSTRAPRPLAHPQGPGQPDLVARRAAADRARRGDAGRGRHLRRARDRPSPPTPRG